MKYIMHIGIYKILYIQGPNPASLFTFSGNQQLYITFAGINNLIKNLLNLNCQELPENTRTLFFLADFTVTQNSKRRALIIGKMKIFSGPRRWRKAKRKADKDSEK